MMTSDRGDARPLCAADECVCVCVFVEATAFSFPLARDGAGAGGGGGGGGRAYSRVHSRAVWSCRMRFRVYSVAIEGTYYILASDISRENSVSPNGSPKDS